MPEHINRFNERWGEQEARFSRDWHRGLSVQSRESRVFQAMLNDLAERNEKLDERLERLEARFENHGHRLDLSRGITDEQEQLFADTPKPDDHE